MDACLRSFYSKGLNLERSSMLIFLTESNYEAPPGSIENGENRSSCCSFSFMNMDFLFLKFLSHLEVFPKF
jgi:hypothetical protein